MRIIVLGASGQIGSVILSGLKKSHDVVGTSRKPSARFLRFDPFHDNWSMLGKADVLINCVGQIDASTGYSFYEIHGELTRMIIENREVVGNPRIIQISALGASAVHPVEFLRTKGEADDYLLQFPETVVVRPSIVCTHRTMIVRKMLMLYTVSRYTLGHVFVPEKFPESLIQPVMPEDLAAVVEKLCAVRDVPKIINVPGAERLSFGEIIEIMFDAKKKTYRLIKIRQWLMDILFDYGLSKMFPSVINSQQYELLLHDNVADTGEAEKYLGRPLRSARDFFKKEFRLCQ